MNETISLIMNRKCIRSYTDQPVPAEAVETILKCGIQAPSAMNGQPWHFTVLKSRRMMDKISADSPMGDMFRGGVMAILISGKTSQNAAWTSGDCANATENMFLAANALGIDCCYLASPCMAVNKSPELMAELGIPEGYSLVYALALGYGNEDPEPKPRNYDCVNYID